MHRRNVDLPEPDGPTRTSTCPLPISNVTPLSTLSAPKFLHTLSALTIGVLVASATVVIGAPPPQPASAPLPAPRVVWWSACATPLERSSAPGRTGPPSGC